MNLNSKDMVTKKLIDAQEMVRDYEMFSKQTEDRELAGLFKNLAEESGLQARELQRMADKYRRK
jgi:rubrerythrin